MRTLAMSTTTLAALERIASPARNAFVDLEYWLYTSASQRLEALEVEQERRGREVFRLLLQAHLRSRGDGDVGPGLTVRPPGGPGTILYRHKRLRSRGLVTVFGAVSVT